MRVPLPPQSRVIKRVVPRSLLGRSLLIILVPLVIVEAVALQIFYGSHLDIVSRRMAASVAGDIAMSIDLLDRADSPAERDWVLRSAFERFEMPMRLEPGELLPRDRHQPLIATVENNFDQALRERVGRRFTMDWQSDPQWVQLRLQRADSVLDVQVPRKRLYAGTVYIFVIWLVGSAALLFGIAALFMRNQVRAIRRLSAAAEAFGMGRDIGPIRPEGATEVRKAATAFNRMQERIGRFLHQRTEMLAGVSHDLRTPLTRLRLGLAMLESRPELREDVAAMTEDVADMDQMIGAYLAFARGVGEEPSRPTDLSAMLESVASHARRAGADITLETPAELVLPLRADAVRRAVTNLVDNARRHAHHVVLAARQLGARDVLVTVDDDGPGIPPERREDMFRPFETGAFGGTGLGLTIARDIVRAHGGDIVLEDSPLGGLRARILLPV